MDNDSKKTIDWAAVRKAYEEGDDPLHIIAARQGTSRSAMHRRRIKEGWSKRKDQARLAKGFEPIPPKLHTNWAQVQLEYEKGDYSVRDLCALHGISQACLYWRRDLESWEARRSAYPRAYGAGGTVNATQRLKILVAKKLTALEARLKLDEKIDVGDPLKGLHTLASAYEKILDIEQKEKLHDDGERIGCLIINDASRLALAKRLDELARAWKHERDSRQPEARGVPPS